MQEFNVTYDLLKYLNNNPAKTIFKSVHGEIKANQFEFIIKNYIAHLSAIGIKQKTLVGLDIDDVVRAHSMTRALSAIGAAWITVNQDVLDAQIPIEYIIYSGNKTYSGDRVLRLDNTWLQPLAISIPAAGFNDVNDICMIAQSSGSTGKPKFIPLTFKTFWHRVNDLKMFNKDIENYFTLFLPLKTSAQYHTLQAMLNGITIIVDTPPKILCEYKNLFCLGSVMQAQKFINLIDCPVDPYDITLEVSGAAVCQQDFEKFIKYFNKVHLNYGSTETSRTYVKRYTSLDNFESHMGTPVEISAGAEIVDENDNLVTNGTTGIIRLPKTSRHANGYFDNNNEQFRLGYFYPGDIGFIDNNNNLHITGRTSNTMINIGGTKFDALAIENVAKSIMDIENCLVFKNTSLPLTYQLSILISTSSTEQDRIIFAVADQVAKILGISQIPISYYFVNDLPLNANGKLTRNSAEKITSSLEPKIIEIDAYK